MLIVFVFFAIVRVSTAKSKQEIPTVLASSNQKSRSHSLLILDLVCTKCNSVYRHVLFLFPPPRSYVLRLVF